MSQLAFDLELEAPETAFDTMQTAENGGKCSRCSRALRGRYGRVHGAKNHLGWFAWCDDCTSARRVPA